MSKIYNTAFQIGILFSVSIFAILNIRSFIIETSEYNNRFINFSPAGYDWGFPFNWGEQYSAVVDAGTILNILFLAISSFFFGFLFRFIWSKISQQNSELK